LQFNFKNAKAGHHNSIASAHSLAYNFCHKCSIDMIFFTLNYRLQKL